MPFVAAAGATAAAVASATSVGVFTALQYAVVATSMHYANRKAKREAGRAGRLARQGREFDIRNTVTPRSLIVGRAAVGVERVVFRKTHGDNRELVTFIACFGAHEIDEVEDILFNGESVGLMSSRDSAGWYQDTNSKYVKEGFRNQAMVAAWPAAGGQIILTGDIQSVISVAAAEGDMAIDLTPGTHYTEIVNVTSGGRSVRIQATAASAPYVGTRTVVTYRTRDNRSLVRAVVYKGVDAGQRDLYAEAIPVQNPNPEPDDPPEQFWTPNHLLRGQPRVSFTLRWDADVFGPTGFPDITFVVRGARCRDWASGATTWTDNSARIAAWYLMRQEGFGAAQSEIASTLAIAAQNACNESVPYGETGGQTQPRYRCGGVIDTTANPIDNLKDILDSMAGDAVPVGPTWDIYAGVAQTPVYTLTDSDLAGGSEEFRSDSGLDTRVNCVRGRFIDAENGYIARDIVPYESPTYIAQDGGEKAWLDIDLPMTTDAWAAQRIARLRLHQARNAATWTTTYNLSAYPVRAGQTIRCQHSEYGWDTMESGAGKRFSAMLRRMHYEGEIELSMIETAAWIYSWNYDEGKEPDPAPNTDFPDPTYVEPLTLHVPVSDSTTYDVGTNGEKVPYVLLSWDPLPPEIAREASRIEIEWKGSGELSYRTERLAPDQTSLKLRPVWGGMLISGSAKVVNELGVSSDPAFFDHRASMDLPGNQQAVSANLLTNPTFKSGVKGWTLYREAGYTDNVYAIKPLAGRISGTPTQIMIEQVGTQAKYGYVASELMSAQSGRRIFVYSGVLAHGCSARVQVNFVNAAGQGVGVAVGNTIPRSSGNDWTNAAMYRMSEAVADVPVGAVGAYVYLLKFGTDAGFTASRADFLKPFFGEVPAGSTQRPPWDPGGLPSIDTGDLEDNAATDVYMPTVSDIKFERTALSPPAPETFTLFSFTPTEPGTVEVTLSASANGQATTATPFSPRAWFGGGNVIVKPGQPSPADNAVTLFTVPGNDTVSGNFSLSGSFEATPGVPVTIQLSVAIGAKSGALDVGSPGPVPKPLPTSIPARMQIQGISLRLTHVKK